MPLQKGFWVFQKETFEIGCLSHEVYAYKKGLTVLTDSDKARLELINKGLVRVRQQSNYWSITVKNELTLSKHVERLKKLIVEHDKHAEVRILLLDEERFLVMLAKNLC